MEVLLREAGIADPWVMAMSLTYALDPPERIVDDVRVRGISPTRLVDSWSELVTRLLGAD